MNKETPIKTIEYNGYFIGIFYDDEPLNPRKTDCQMGNLYLSSSCNFCGDKNISQDQIESILEDDDKLSLGIYLAGEEFVTDYLMERRGKPIGVIWFFKDDLRTYYPPSSDGKSFDEIVECAKTCMNAEVETYSDYNCGKVYGYAVFEKEEDVGNHLLSIESCWGFYEDKKDTYNYTATIQAAKEMIDGLIEGNKEKEIENKRQEELIDLCWAI